MGYSKLCKCMIGSENKIKQEAVVKIQVLMLPFGEIRGILELGTSKEQPPNCPKTPACTGIFISEHPQEQNTCKSHAIKPTEVMLQSGLIPPWGQV